MSEPLFKFHSGAAGQLSNVSNRQSAGVIVDAELGRLVAVHVWKVCRLNAFVRAK